MAQSNAGTKGVPRLERENQILEIASEIFATVPSGDAGLAHQTADMGGRVLESKEFTPAGSIQNPGYIIHEVGGAIWTAFSSCSSPCQSSTRRLRGPP